MIGFIEMIETGKGSTFLISWQQFFLNTYKELEPPSTISFVAKEH